MDPGSNAQLPEDKYRSTPNQGGDVPVDPSLGERLAKNLSGFPLETLDPGGVTSPATLRVLALATLLQYREQLSDPQTAQALATRPDWQAALQLPTTFPGLDPAVLCAFRLALRNRPEPCLAFGALLERLAGMVIPLPVPPPAELLEVVCYNHRQACVIEAATQLIEALATSHPEWFGTVVLPHWYTRYHPGAPHLRPATPPDEAQRLVQTIGADLTYLLGIIGKSTLPDLLTLPEVRTAQSVWSDNYEPMHKNGLPSQVVWRPSFCARCKQSRAQGPQNGKFKHDDYRSSVPV